MVQETDTPPHHGHAAVVLGDVTKPCPKAPPAPAPAPGPHPRPGPRPRPRPSPAPAPGPKSALWKCGLVDNKCVQDPTGTDKTKALCEKRCSAPSPGPRPKPPAPPGPPVGPSNSKDHPHRLRNAVHKILQLL